MIVCVYLEYKKVIMQQVQSPAHVNNFPLNLLKEPAFWLFYVYQDFAHTILYNPKNLNNNTDNLLILKVLTTSVYLEL